MAATEQGEREFTDDVAAALEELSNEKPSVSEQELADKLGLGDGSTEPDRLQEALDELAGVSVASLVGENTEKGRMWRHTGMTAEQTAHLVAVSRVEDRQRREREERAEVESEHGEDDLEALARARADEIEHDRGDDGEPPAPRAHGSARASAGGEPNRIEMPMAVASQLEPSTVADLVKVGIAQAADGDGGFEFVVRP